MKNEDDAAELEHPFSTPFSAGVDSGAPEAPRCDFSVVIRSWDRLRILYNVVLAAEVLLLAAIVEPSLFLKFEFWLQCVVAAVIANLFFTLGPAVEGYGRCFIGWHWIATATLFILGLGFSILFVLLIFFG